ncbi:hypothetical protein QWY79_15040 [Halomonas sabkhae]|uniref:hypothetical protein n=1 Tax=Halomonas sabkhae TaxID=626223 RepID=UPI0025B2A74A|nr:hypothetical protein [Halomonas sabkhae]MDN3526585.1 hypothetical protein [Halomonas sabkhae]
MSQVNNVKPAGLRPELEAGSLKLEEKPTGLDPELEAGSLKLEEKPAGLGPELEAGRQSNGSQPGLFGLDPGVTSSFELPAAKRRSSSFDLAALFQLWVHPARLAGTIAAFLIHTRLAASGIEYRG